MDAQVKLKQREDRLIELNAYNITQQSDFNSKKSGIALDILLMKERFIPQYIMEGLEWLSKN